MKNDENELHINFKNLKLFVRCESESFNASYFKSLHLMVAYFFNFY